MDNKGEILYRNTGKRNCKIWCARILGVSHVTSLLGNASNAAVDVITSSLSTIVDRTCFFFFCVTWKWALLPMYIFRSFFWLRGAWGYFLWGVNVLRREDDNSSLFSAEI
jgi:hypothetical protein